MDCQVCNSNMTLKQRVTKIFQQQNNKNLSKEIGASGTQIWNGMVMGEEYLSSLDTGFGGNGLRIYNQMRRSDPVVRATLKLIEHSLKKGKWYIEGVGSTPQDEEIKAFVEDAMFSRMTTTWNELLRLIATQYVYGFCVFEKIFIEIDGKIYWKKLAYRSQSSIEKFQTKNGEEGITQQLSGEQLGAGGPQPSIPIWKLLLFTHEKEGDNWRGTSLLRGAYKPYYFKEALEKIEAIGYERQSVGIPVSTMPIDPDPQDKETIKQLLENIRANEKAYALLPNGWQIEMMDMKGNMTKDPGEAIARKNWEIAINILAPHVLMGSQDVGSFALAKVLADVFINSVLSYAQDICDVFNAHAIPQLVDLNFANVKDYPRLQVTDIKDVEIDKLATTIMQLANTGFIGYTEQDEDYLREVIDLPPLSDEDKAKREGKGVDTKPVKPAEAPSDVDVDIEPKKKVIQASERFWRSITAAESSVNFPKLENVMNELEADFVRIVERLLGREAKEIQKVVATALETQNPALLLLYKTKYRRELIDEIEQLYFSAIDRGKVLAANEIGKAAPATASQVKSLASLKAEAVADNLITSLLNEARFAVIDVTERGIAAQTAIKTVGDLVKSRVLLSISRASSSTMVGGLNLGRKITHDNYKSDIYSLVRSELLDKRTCNYCLSVDGRSVQPDDPFADIDIFHLNCRGIWFAVLNEEIDKPPITGIPNHLRASVGTLSEFKQLSQPEPLGGGLADAFLNPRG